MARSKRALERIREAAGALARFLGTAPEDTVFVENATAGMNAVLRIFVWLLALSVVALPVVAVVNGWVGAERWPLAKHWCVRGCPMSTRPCPR